MIVSIISFIIVVKLFCVVMDNFTDITFDDIKNAFFNNKD